MIIIKLFRFVKKIIVNYRKSFLLFGFLCFSPACFPITKIYFWHSMSGSELTLIQNIVDQFNHSQSKYKVIPIYKGSYNDTLTATVAAFRAHQQPAIVQVFEVGTATMIHPKGIIIPVYQLMKLAKLSLSSKDFLPAVADYYSDTQGRLLGMPFNSSSAVLYYNKNAFKKAGLNPNNPPTTWPQLVEDSKKILKAGFRCGFTTTWPSWIQVETFSAWHNLPLATQDNGFKSIHAKLIFNNAIVVKQIASLTKWEKENIFRYGGREDNAQSLFTSGICAMMMQSSGSAISLKNMVDFDLGVGKIPYWPNVKGAPQNTIIGGAALWALSGFSDNVYKGVAQFFKFLASTPIQIQWQNSTGYIAVTKNAFNKSKKRGDYKKFIGSEIAIEELNNKPPKPYTKGLRLGNYSEIRDIIEEEMEAAITGRKTAKQAMDEAVKRGNKMLEEFEQNLQ